MNLNKRMTWQEIIQQYPDQWLGLSEVEHESDNASTIKSAVVRYAGKSKNELTLMQIKSKGKFLARYTNPNKLFQLGVWG